MGTQITFLVGSAILNYKLHFSLFKYAQVCSQITSFIKLKTMIKTNMF